MGAQIARICETQENIGPADDAFPKKGHKMLSDEMDESANTHAVEVPGRRASRARASKSADSIRNSFLFTSPCSVGPQRESESGAAQMSTSVARYACPTPPVKTNSPVSESKGFKVQMRAESLGWSISEISSSEIGGNPQPITEEVEEGNLMEDETSPTESVTSPSKASNEESTPCKASAGDEGIPETCEEPCRAPQLSYTAMNNQISPIQSKQEQQPCDSLEEQDEQAHPPTSEQVQHSEEHKVEKAKTEGDLAEDVQNITRCIALLMCEGNGHETPQGSPTRFGSTPLAKRDENCNTPRQDSEQMFESKRGPKNSNQKPRYHRKRTNSGTKKKKVGSTKNKNAESRHVATSIPCEA